MKQKITASIHWEIQANEAFLKGRYSRTHSWALEGGALNTCLQMIG